MAPSDSWAVQTRGLSCNYGTKPALERLELAIPHGGIHALVGANGAGKSTLFRILLGFLQPTAGEAFVLGRPSHALTPADRARIGFVNEEHTLPVWMAVDAVVGMQRRQYARWEQATFNEVIGHYDVNPGQKIGQLSRGERAGLNLALALAQRPELLILDEPTLGLDVVAKRAFLESLLYSSATEACTVVYCSHQMEEVERVADNLVILERGRLRNVSAPDDFRERIRHWVADVPFRGPDAACVPGLLEMRRIDGLHHFVVIDQGDGFTDFLSTLGARHVRCSPVSLDRAVNAYLSRGHAAPARHRTMEATT